MLKHLYIKNYTLIDELDVEFHSGFSVITGETGAGKSIILGAIGLLLGQRADTKTIKNGADRCVIEAHFDLSRYGMEKFFIENNIEEDTSDTILRRELMASGKSRAFINDTPVSLSLIKELGDRLVDVHSQHQNLLLAKQDFQLNVVDVIAEDSRELEDYQQTYETYQQIECELKSFKEELLRGQQETDFLQFQYDELSSAKLVDGEQEELELKSDQMTHSEEIKHALYETENAFSADNGNVLSMLKRSALALHSVEQVYHEAEELASRIDSCYIELKDIANDVSGRLEDVDFDPSELDIVNERLDRIYELQKKYHVSSIAELITICKNLEGRLGKIEHSDEVVTELEQKLARQKDLCRKKADELTKKRIKAAKKIEELLQQKLVPLGMPNVRFKISITQEQLGVSGQDKVSFLFSANTSSLMQPVSQIASGGEIARVMLSIKSMISGFVKLPTIIFDEIDTGVSGKIAEQMAQMMHEMGRLERQVISITHLPQIASLGTYHYKVYKEETSAGTISRMQQLSMEERVKEIAQMLSGSDVSNAAIENAKQLLNIQKS